MDKTSKATAWLVCALVAATQFGNNYVYDSIGPVADLLQQQRGFSSTDIGTLNAIYNLPNIVLLLIGGYMVDRFGAARMTLATALVCLAGALLTAYSPSFAGMAGGRLLFGIGAETFGIATTAAIAQYFAGAEVAFAMGLTLSIGRLGSYTADKTPDWFASAFTTWQPPLVIAAGMAATACAAALLLWWIDRGRRHGAAAEQAQPFQLKDLKEFGKAFWYLLILCVLWYSCILAFRSTFAITYFQHAFGLDLAAAGNMNSYVFLAAVFATPAFGWICDRVGRYAPFLAFGALLLPIAFAVLLLGKTGLGLSTVLIGISYSLVPAVMWPLTSKLVSPKRFGTAIGVMWVVQNAGIGGANMVAGWLNDGAHASATNPAGYQPMMMFFLIASSLGALCAFALWFSAGRKNQEQAHHSGETAAAA